MSGGYYFDVLKLRDEQEGRKFFSEFYENQLTARVNTLKELCGRLPEENEAFFIETKKSFSAFAFCAYVIREVGRIDRLYIATYSTNERIINAIIRWMHKGCIGSLHFHVSETLQFRMPAVWQRLKQMEKDGLIVLTTAWSHKKVACMITPSGYFVVEGSGNYGENSLNEQYVFLNSKKVCQFRMSDSK